MDTRYLIPVLCVGLALSASAQNCEPAASTRQILEQLQVPDSLRQPEPQRQELRLEILRKALAAAPADLFLHEAYQNARLGGMEINRPALIDEYEKLLEKNPHDPVFLYLAANAEMGRKTKDAIANLKRALDLAPDFALAHLLLARIDSAHDYDDPAQASLHLERFAASCPASARTLPSLKWNNDKELVRREAARLRKSIDARTDSEAVAAYPALWGAESALQRSDQQAENQAKMRHDIDRLFGKEFVRNSAWLATIEATDFFDGAPEGVIAKARHEVAALYPDSEAAMNEQRALAMGDAKYPDNGTPEQVTAYFRHTWQAELPLARKWPNAHWLVFQATNAIVLDRSAGTEEVNGALKLFLNAARQNPNGFHSLPPIPITLAQRLVDRGGPFEDVPALVVLGLAEADREFDPSTANDVSGTSSTTLARMQDTFYTMGYVPMAEAYVRLGQLSDAEDVLTKAQVKLQAIRPAESSSPNEKVRFGDLAAPYWVVRGHYAEKRGRKMDALVDYRNALGLYPPRRPDPDGRDDVMTSAQRLWTELGGTSEGWSDWASQSSLAGFYAGSGGSEAWSKLAKSSPDLVLTDALGNRWSPSDLAKKTTFVTVWASWCGPCRAELPYVEKLRERFKNRSDIAILALNVDDDPKAMTKALQELKTSVPSVAAGDFAFSIVPSVGLPANWIITAKKTDFFEGGNSSHDAWLEAAAAAIEKAAGN